MVITQVIQRLNSEGVNYKLLTHNPVYTCEEAAKATRSKLRQHVKAMLLIDINNRPVVVLLPGDKHVSLHKVAKAIGVQKVRLASPKEVKTTLGVETGAVSALIAEGILMLLDVSVMRNRLVYMSAGTHTDSIMISPKDFQRVIKAKLTSIIE